MENIDTKQLEIAVLQNKVKKLGKEVEAVVEKVKTTGTKMNAKETLEFLEHQRSEFVQCIELFLGFPLLGIDGAERCLKIVAQIDLYITTIKMAESLGGLM